MEFRFIFNVLTSPHPLQRGNCSCSIQGCTKLVSNILPIQGGIIPAAFKGVLTWFPISRPIQRRNYSCCLQGCTNLIFNILPIQRRNNSCCIQRGANLVLNIFPPSKQLTIPSLKGARGMSGELTTQNSDTALPYLLFQMESVYYLSDHLYSQTGPLTRGTLK